MESAKSGSGVWSFCPRSVLESNSVQLEPWSDTVVLEPEHLELVASNVSVSNDGLLDPFVGTEVVLSPMEFYTQEFRDTRGINLSCIEQRVGEISFLPPAAIFWMLAEGPHDKSGVNNLMFFKIDEGSVVYRVLHDPYGRNKALFMKACPKAVKKLTHVKVLLVK